MRIFLFVVLLLLSIFSYGFKDPNLILSTNSTLLSFIAPLVHLVYDERPWAASIFFLFVVLLFVFYLVLLRSCKEGWKKLGFTIAIISVILSFSYPALTYDLFNYITTAKVSYTYHENPYLVMPIEIPNEPYLAFTRAANKVALYGPIWIALSYIPYLFGNGNIWQTIIMFKLFTACFYMLFTYLVYRITKSIKNVIFFAFNPLILIETLVSGHNDIVMIVFAVIGIYLCQEKTLHKKIIGLVSLLTSVLVKGATIVIVPLLFIKNISRDTFFRYAYMLLAIVFFVFAPLREELYPWYAVWLICFASLLDMKKNAFIITFTIMLSFTLELRHLPYMWMGYYEGPGPLFRFALTVIPLAFFIIYVFLKKLQKHHE